MPIAKRRSEVCPRQEFFDGDSGNLKFEVVFNDMVGYLLREIADLHERVTRGLNTTIVVQGISREKLVALQQKFAEAVEAADAADVDLVNGQVDALLGEVRKKVDIFLSSPLNFALQSEIDGVLDRVKAVLDSQREKSLRRQRDIILRVLLDDEDLRQT